MSNNPQFADATVIAAVAAACALLNGGFLEVYSGSQPADANTAVTSQVKLATLGLGSPAFGTPSASGSAGSRVVTATATAITEDDNAAATGTATWFRSYRSDGVTVVHDGSVGTSGADLNLSTASILAGGTVAVSAFTITHPET